MSAGDDRGARAARGGGTAWLGARWLRERAPAVTPLLVVVVLGTAGAMLAAGTAQRTSSAYDHFLERAHVGDVLINPSLSSTDIDQVIRRLPGVTEVTSDALFMVTNDEGQPRTRDAVESEEGPGGIVGVFGSHDGRYASTDRPEVRAGRLPTGPSELAISAGAAEAAGMALGDVVPLAFWQLGVSDGLAAEAAQAFDDEVIAPIGVEHLRLVGLLTFPDEVLPNELYPRERGIVSPDVARRYDCVPPPPDPALSLAENVRLLLPSNSAVSYRYYSVSFANGAAGVKPALDAFVREIAPLNDELAAIEDTSGRGSTPPSYFLISTETEPEAQRVARATQPTVAALGVLAAAAGLVTLVLAGLGVARESRRGRSVQEQWRQLGMTRWARTVVTAVPPVLAIVAGIAGAFVVAAVLGTRPVGVVSVLEPHRTRGIDHLAVAVGLFVAAGALMLALALVAGAARADAEGARRPARNRLLQRASAAVPRPASADGVRAAFGQRTATLVIAGGAVVTAACVAALVFGASLTALVGTPRTYGWPWDLALMTGSGYGDLDLPQARKVLTDDPDVAHWTTFGFLNEATLDGDPMMSVVGLERDTLDVDFPVLVGRLPIRADEVALGAVTARERGLSVGDTVRISGVAEPAEAEVTGLVVFPTLGPLFAGEVSAGTGMLLPQAMVEAGGRTDITLDLATFVGIDLHDGVDAQAAQQLQDRLAGIDLQGAPARVYRTPIRPPEVIEAAATRSVPLIVGGLLVVVGGLGLAVVSWASMRTRRHDVAVLRALGFSPRQVATSVRVQSVAVVAAALVVGVPIGIVIGRISWRAFARQLGVVSDPAPGGLAIAGLVVAALVLALAAAQLPARSAALAPPTVGLRAE